MYVTTKIWMLQTRYGRYDQDMDVTTKIGRYDQDMDVTTKIWTLQPRHGHYK